ncbi:MAG: hypothetical protein GF381_02335 [Candidatus Pacebacteria bacterium]|nr:hypothetical protein [Candidatus Paceibacterota bacterium]
MSNNSNSDASQASQISGTSDQYQVQVDRSKCISAASCIALAPQTFQLDDQELAKVICQNCDSDQAKLLAAQSCPTGAIKVKKIDNKEVIWPKP